jgi:kinesin family protein 18/19
VERNVLDVSYHVSQYRTIISELREEIARLRAKMKEDRPRSGDTSNDKAEKLKLLRDKVVSTFREQMRLRCASFEVIAAV